MKILHICLLGPFTDHFSYQENNITDAQQKFGHRITVITSCRQYSDKKDGSFVPTKAGKYFLNNGVEIIRLPVSNKYNKPGLRRFLNHYDIVPVIRELDPDIVCVHGVGVMGTNADLKKSFKLLRKKNKSCVICADSHNFAELVKKPNSYIGYFIQWWRRCTIRDIAKEYDLVFPITPACQDYANKFYGIPNEKMVLLPLGFDEEKCSWDNRVQIRAAFREKNGIKDDDVVIIHGGKINKRRLTTVAIDAVKRLNNQKVKLVIFGGIAPDMQQEVEEQINSNDWIIYLGSLEPEEYYKAYLASDIAFFPGGQSSLWQEAIGCGLPLVVGSADNISYLDVGGNMLVAERGNAEKSAEALKSIIDSKHYMKMAEIAAAKGREFFSYDCIAQMFINECVKISKQV